MTIAHPPPATGMALLVLAEPVPPEVEAAPLRFPRPADLAGRAWWAFGFPDRDPVGHSAAGVVGAALALGWVRLDSPSGYLLRPGFGGAGLWSPDYRAVVGIVGRPHPSGKGRAITLHQADLWLPGQLAGLARSSAEAAGEAAVQQWGWTLARDPEGVRHWRPRARGVSIDSERGYRFRGRTAALRQITGWLDRPEPDRRVLVVTGLAAARRRCRPGERGLGGLRGARQGEDGAGGRRGDRPRRLRPAARRPRRPGARGP
jgi:hypothetical protein